MRNTAAALAFLAVLILPPARCAAAPVVVASKSFTESYILAEIVAQKLERRGLAAERRFGMGGTGMTFDALVAGEIDVYPEYTGTIAEALLKDAGLREWEDISEALKPLGLVMTRPLGFNNTYALAVSPRFGPGKELRSVSDLRDAPPMRIGLSHEFIKRSDGFEALKRHYGLPALTAAGMEHSLAYQAAESGAVDLIDVYSTDAKIEKLGLRLLADDKEFFPRYEAVLLARRDFAESSPEAWKVFSELEGAISDGEMRALNALCDIEKYSFKAAGLSFFGLEGGEKRRKVEWSKLAYRTAEHLALVLVSLLASILAGVPLGVLASRNKFFERTILSVSGVIQTIPSLALLCFFIPLFGIGTWPALAALFLYGLLPIVRNTFLGISSIPASLREMTAVLGLSGMQDIKWVKLPLSSKGIMAGIKTSAVINVGTATLAAFIGAGGYGTFIVTGLALNDIPMMLHGAVPAALLALLIQWVFDGLESLITPAGLKAHLQTSGA
ncbi:MAG: glycine betaine ABC transporter substrate-binding protein [Elusimicrobiales bacterium]|nr:glycine betaine ABC transporter substrate-binding protein [Elusimicrobiales bacterium]